MTIVQAIVYGVVQGLTEFLPVSSTAHLRIVPELLGWQDAGAAFTAVIQLGTVGAVLVYFRSDLSKALSGFIKSLTGGPKDTIEAKTGWAVFYATIPICILGFALKDFIEGPFRSLWVIGSSLIFMGLVMAYIEKSKLGERNLDSVERIDGIKIGFWQCLSLIPGMSRSGSSISGAFFSGFNRETATRLSFLMSVPAITLAGLYEGIKEIKKLSGELMIPTIVATIVSFVVGFACIKWLIGFVQKRGLIPFVAYRVVLGIVILGLCAAGVLKPESPKEATDVSKEVTNTR